MCHFQVSSHLLVGSICHRVAGDLRASPLLLPRPVICHGPPVPTPHAAARPSVSHGSLCGLPLLLSPSPHSARPCATFRSPHTDGGFHFV
ncbi:unnamed protein product, partial [Staurois parvus]